MVDHTEVAVGISTNVWMIARYIRSLTDDPVSRERIVAAVATSISKQIIDQTKRDTFQGKL